MAAIYKCSFDEKGIGRFQISNRIKNNSMIFLRSKQEIGSYYNAKGKKVIFNYDGSNCLYIRIDPYMAQLVKNSIEYNKFKDNLIELY